MTETPSHAELVAAIEQARPLHWRTREADDERRAHLDTLTDILRRHIDCCSWDDDIESTCKVRACIAHYPQEQPWSECADVATVTTALRKMGAL